jgi:hypothetical protein
MSSPSEPVGTAWMSWDTSASPSFMIEPLPNCFSIWDRAACRALRLLSSMMVAICFSISIVFSHKRERR